MRIAAGGEHEQRAPPRGCQLRLIEAQELRCDVGERRGAGGLLPGRELRLDAVECEPEAVVAHCGHFVG